MDKLITGLLFFAGMQFSFSAVHCIEELYREDRVPTGNTGVLVEYYPNSGAELTVALPTSCEQKHVQPLIDSVMARLYKGQDYKALNSRIYQAVGGKLYYYTEFRIAGEVQLLTLTQFYDPGSPENPNGTILRRIYSPSGFSICVQNGADAKTGRLYLGEYFRPAAPGASYREYIDTLGGNTWHQDCGAGLPQEIGAKPGHN